jgi:hypothetical protein
LVAVELVELVIAGLVSHGGVVDGEDAEEVFGVLGGGDDGFRGVDGFAMRIPSKIWAPWSARMPPA